MKDPNVYTGTCRKCRQSKKPPLVDTNEYKLYCNVEIHTDKTITCYRPDIVLQNKKQITYLIDISMPINHNIQTKYV